MKYFCIGVWKTATTTVGFALNELVKGPHCGWNIPNRRMHLEGNVNELRKVIKNHRTFDDTPWNTMKMIHIVKDEYPDSKFVLTERDPCEWIDSMIQWNFDDIAHPMIGHLYTKDNVKRVKVVMTKKEIEEQRLISPVYRMYKEELEFFDFKLRRMEVLSRNKDAWIAWRYTRKKYLQNLLGDRLLTIKFGKDKPLSWELLSTWINKHNPDVKVRKGKMKKYNSNKIKPEK